jgi:hypothetical protein
MGSAAMSGYDNASLPSVIKSKCVRTKLDLLGGLERAIPGTPALRIFTKVQLTLDVIDNDLISIHDLPSKDPHLLFSFIYHDHSVRSNNVSLLDDSYFLLREIVQSVNQLIDLA